MLMALPPPLPPTTITDCCCDRLAAIDETADDVARPDDAVEDGVLPLDLLTAVVAVEGTVIAAVGPFNTIEDDI